MLARLPCQPGHAVDIAAGAVVAATIHDNEPDQLTRRPSPDRNDPEPGQGAGRRTAREAKTVLAPDPDFRQ